MSLLILGPISFMIACVFNLFYCSFNLHYDRHARGYKQLIKLHLNKNITNAHDSRGLCLCKPLCVKCQLYFVQVISKNVVNWRWWGWCVCSYGRSLF